MSNCNKFPSVHLSISCKRGMCKENDGWLFLGGETGLGFLLTWIVLPDIINVECIKFMSSS